MKFVVVYNGRTFDKAVRVGGRRIVEDIWNALKWCWSSADPCHKKKLENGILPVKKNGCDLDQLVQITNLKKMMMMTSIRDEVVMKTLMMILVRLVLLPVVIRKRREREPGWQQRRHPPTVVARAAGRR
jgi:iron only hydrogenase large subunit-like protein